MAPGVRVTGTSLSRSTPTLRHVLVRAGRQPGIAWYILDEARGAFLPAELPA